MHVTIFLLKLPKKFQAVVCASALFGVFLAEPVHATVTVIDYYQLGENDPGALAGNPVVATVDAVGAKNLPATNSPLYSCDVSSSAATQTASRLSVSFPGGNQSLAGPVVSTVTNNFGLEAWVKANATASSINVLAF